MLLTELNKTLAGDVEDKQAQTDLTNSTGTYVGLSYTKESKDTLRDLLKDVPNPIPEAKMHTTLIYSRKPFKFTAKGDLDPPIVAKPKHYSIFKTAEGAFALVLELDCKAIVDRHEYIMDKHKATYDHAEFKPHVTLSYDVGAGFDLKSLPAAKTLPELVANREYTQELDLNWTASKKKA